MITLCPCGSGLAFVTCCKSIIDGKSIAYSAEQLMRSRYSAFVAGDVDYLLRSHHPSTRPIKERSQMLQWMNSVQWLGLTILDTVAGQSTDSKGYVEFKAFYVEGNQTQIIHEKSLFEKENGCWVYVNGIHY